MPDERWWTRWYDKMGKLFDELPEPERALVLQMAEHFQPGQTDKIQKMIGQNIMDVTQMLHRLALERPVDENQEFLRLLSAMEGKAEESS
ncbi:MAG TPA: hypothetical protein PLF96_12495 [Thermotogota bacterium]|nr:hypothetical protein [Thermotogota bacterium]